MATKFDKSISKILTVFKIPSIKRLGQNFIKNQEFADKMIEIANVTNCSVIDVGAGPTTLSASCAKAGASSIHAIEIDQRFIPIFERFILKNRQIPIYFNHCDMLKVDFYSLIANSVDHCKWSDGKLPNARIVGNLPFNVSIPLILKLAKSISTKTGLYQIGRIPLYLVLQKEIAHDLMRITKASRLSTIINTYFSTGNLIEIPRYRFVPSPNVDASFIELIPRKDPTTIVEFQVYEQVVKALYTHPNKQILRNIRLLFPDTDKGIIEEAINRTNVDFKLSARQITLEDFNSIAVTFHELCTKYNLPMMPLTINNRNIQ